jgi:DNA-binding MarR family transcriptional regulator
MHDQSSSPESEAQARLDQAVLQVLLDSERPRPLSETEVARLISTPGHVPASFKRLRVAGLIQRWNDLATASHAAVYYREITQRADRASEQEHHADRAVLESLIVRGNNGQGPLSEHDLWDAFSARKKKQKLRITDALDRLEAAGLIERRGGRSMASEVAKTLDRILAL